MICRVRVALFNEGCFIEPHVRSIVFVQNLVKWLHYHLAQKKESNVEYRIRGNRFYRNRKTTGLNSIAMRISISSESLVAGHLWGHRFARSVILVIHRQSAVAPRCWDTGKMTMPSKPYTRTMQTDFLSNRILFVGDCLEDTYSNWPIVQKVRLHRLG